MLKYYKIEKQVFRWEEAPKKWCMGAKRSVGRRLPGTRARLARPGQCERIIKTLWLRRENLSNLFLQQWTVLNSCLEAELNLV